MKTREPRTRGDSLRDQAAEPTMRRIRQDRERVSKRLQPVLEVIERDLFSAELNVTYVWRESGITSKNAPSWFSWELETTPLDYITACRLEVGAALLVRTDLRIWHIGPLLGFSSGEVFARRFKDRYRRSPRLYRKDPTPAPQPAAEKPAADKPAGPVSAAAPRQVLSLAAFVDQAFTAGDYGGALAGISDVHEAVSEEAVRELAGHLGLIAHRRGAARKLAGDVDRAYDDLNFARVCYGKADELIVSAHRPGGISCETGQALLGALCSSCRTSLQSQHGRSLRRHLLDALDPVPRDLEWFEDRHSCDACYRIVWDAVARARHGLLDNAWQAWWVSRNVDPVARADPPSRGRFIAALVEAERRTFQVQGERRVYCRYALDDARALDDPALTAYAETQLANVERAMGDPEAASGHLAAAEAACREIPWLDAFHREIAAGVEIVRNRYDEALAGLGSAFQLYKELDPHVAGLVLVRHTDPYFWTRRYDEAIAVNREALGFLDVRRDPLLPHGLVPINLAVSLGGLGRWAEAEAALATCRFDREAHGGLAATEIFTRACLALGRGQPREASRLCEEAEERFRELNRPRDAALAASYSVEAHAHLGERERSVERLTSALSFFQKAGCRQDTMEALAKLERLLLEDVIDALAVTATVRGLTRPYGGWLPELPPL